MDERVVLYRTSTLGIVVSGFLAYPNGISMILRTLGSESARDPVGMMRPDYDPTALRFGVRFGDGRRAALEDLITRRGSKDVPAAALHPVLAGGSGADSDWHLEFWVWPLPPPGDLTFAIEWPARGIRETAVTLDSEPFREAAGGAFSL